MKTWKGNKDVKAVYENGQSRYGDYGVAYMLVNIKGVELYAETTPLDDEDRESEILSAEISRQAEEKGIDLDYYNPIFDN